jgi:hypothetical protein
VCSIIKREWSGDLLSYERPCEYQITLFWQGYVAEHAAAFRIQDIFWNGGKQSGQEARKTIFPFRLLSGRRQDVQSKQRWRSGRTTDMRKTLVYSNHWLHP